jgi:FixJ family two-component response regulator
MVARLGAHVELFTSAVDALASLSVGPPVDLLLSDVVMAPIGGRELVERARAAGFAGAVLLMSGYPADELVREGIVRGDVELLEKPFTRAALREALDRALQHGRAPVATAR